MKILLERERHVRKTVNGVRGLHPVWEKAWTAELLYADDKFIVTRSAGSHQTFYGVPSAKLLESRHSADWMGDGGVRASTWGHDPKHPDVAKLGLKKNRWGHLDLGHIRIAPKSVRKMRATMTANRMTFLTR